MAHVMDYRRYSIGIPTPPAAPAAPTYYTYKDPYPATENHPHAVQIETKADWPKSYRYNSNQNTTQGIHPPGPVYQANQAPAAWYYNQYYGAQVSLKTNHPSMTLLNRGSNHNRNIHTAMATLAMLPLGPTVNTTACQPQPVRVTTLLTITISPLPLPISTTPGPNKHTPTHPTQTTIRNPISTLNTTRIFFRSYRTRTHTHTCHI